MSNPFHPRQRVRIPSRRTGGLGSASTFTSLGSLGVSHSALTFDEECALESCDSAHEDCECEAHPAELAKSYEIFSDEAFTVGDFTITPLRRR